MFGDVFVSSEVVCRDQGCLIACVAPFTSDALGGWRGFPKAVTVAWAELARFAQIIISSALGMGLRTHNVNLIPLYIPVHCCWTHDAVLSNHGEKWDDDRASVWVPDLQTRRKLPGGMSDCTMEHSLFLFTDLLRASNTKWAVRVSETTMLALWTCSRRYHCAELKQDRVS